jgi:hypothetical protein
MNLLEEGEETKLEYGQLKSTGSNIRLMNNGHTVQVVIPSDYKPNVTVAVRGK